VEVLRLTGLRVEELLELTQSVAAPVPSPNGELVGFRRIFATELVNNELPIHIGAALFGHTNVQTTRGSARGRVRRGRRPALPPAPGPACATGHST
jgi:hypothetical protein